GLSHREQRVLLALAQRGLHLARIAAPCPGEYQREQPQQQQFDPDAQSTQRYPMPYTVCTASNFGSMAWNFRRTRLMCEVMVLSSSTTLAASMSCWRFL